MIGTEDVVTIDDWSLGAAYQHVEIKANDATLNVTGIESLVSAMSSFTEPGLGETIDTVDPTDQLDPVIVANWQ